jgi:hypothetical protein
MQEFQLNIAKPEYLAGSPTVLRNWHDEVRMTRFPETISLRVAENPPGDTSITLAIAIHGIRKSLLGLVHQVTVSARLVAKHGFGPPEDQPLLIIIVTNADIT